MTDWHADVFRRDGYSIVEGVFSLTEVRAMRDTLEKLLTLDIPERVLEADGITVRSIYNVHNLDPLFGRLVRDERVASLAVEASGGEDVYIHQTQANPKAAFLGDVWDWHQDFVTWSRDDAMPEPRALNVSVLLDDMTEFNGPLFVIPGSHVELLQGETAVARDSLEGNLGAKQRHQVGADAVRRCATLGGLVSVKAPAGSVVLFHSNILHSSPPNLSPWTRTIVYIRYNPVSNALGPVEHPRAEWIASRRPTPISMVSGALV